MRLDLDFLTAVVAVCLLMAFFRIMYQIALGLLYVKPSISGRSNKPLVSVIIPAWNEEIGVVRTIESVMNSTYYNIELIIIDDGSTDDTSGVVRALIDRYPNRQKFKIRLVTQKNIGKAGALNTGIAIAKGQLVLTLDADSYLMPNSIELLTNTFMDPKYDVAIGEVVVGNTKQLLGIAQHYEYLVGFHLKRSQHVTNSSYIFPGALTMFKSDILRQVGGYADYSSTEDLDMSMKIRAIGGQVAYVDSAICVTEGAITLGGLINQRTRWRHGYIECMLARKDFTRSLVKGKYLSLVELPINVLSVFEILLLPFFVLLVASHLILTSSYLVLVMSYLLLPMIILLLTEVRSYQKLPVKFLLLMPVLSLLVSIIEYIALHKAIYRTVTRKKTAWTNWQRQGL